MAGLIPQAFIDDLVNRADIVDVVDSRVSLKKTGKNYSGLCPFHQEKSPSFSVEPEKQFYYCFGCGAHGNAIGFIMNYENMDYPQAIESLASSMGLEVPREESIQAKQTREKNRHLYDALQLSAIYYQQQLRHHKQNARAVDYLKKRGLSGEVARDYGLGYAPPGWNNLLDTLNAKPKLNPETTNEALLLEAGMLIEKTKPQKNSIYDRFRDRIIYPIKDRRGRVIAFGGRVLGDDKPKYLNSPETPIFHKGEELYGLFEARQKVKKLERVLIVEGYMDVIALAQNKIHYCVATLGTATSEEHLKRLFKLVPEVIFCFDGDNAGRDAAWRALQQALPLMKDGRSARFLFLPDGEDPDSQVRKVGSQKFIQNINEAKQLTEFFFETLSSQVDMNSLEGRAKLGTIAMPHISHLPQGIFRQLIIEQLANITGANQQTLNNMISPSDSIDQKKHEAPPLVNVNIPPVKADGVKASYRPSSPASTQAKKGSHSVCLKIVNLILLQPNIVNLLDDLLANPEELNELQNNDIALLIKVVELAQAHPSSTPVELMGRLYALPLGTQLVQLLNREQIIPKEGVQKEFTASIQRILADHRQKKSQSTMLEEARQNLHSKRISTKDNNKVREN